MSVDTYLAGKDLSSYRRIEQAGIEILVAPAVLRRADRITLERTGALFWTSLRALVAHEHAPT